ncbi:MAG TPA: acetyl-CoA decarbonylase/synthase complex subunit gamma [Chloroflexi bacterium]|nr:MAG: acetyl-CoA decarbonylase/synthase complex subunit gamma [Chloroflexota bacterium]HDD56116.1 acetyl-CoA decarbonylase/synthase complex subunit gamma [Chloroflexota bacterium]
MALTGIQIYKLLPQTNCKECEFPTCLAFAMKLAAKQVELAKCPYVSEESAALLAEASAPPVRPITIKSNGHEVKGGNEVVLFRHNKKFFSPPGLFIRVYDDQPAAEIQAKVKPVDEYVVDYVGMDLSLGGIAVQGRGGDFGAAVKAVREATSLPLILIGSPEVLKSGLENLAGDETPLLCSATAENWEAMADLAKEHNVPLALEADNIDAMVDLAEKLEGKGLKDLVLAPKQRSLIGTLTANTTIRRMALKENFRPLGFPIINFPGDCGDPVKEVTLAMQAIGKYSSFIVLDNFDPANAYALLVLRANIYTDPQEPIQVTPGIYEINDPGPEDPFLVTTNFSITYFSVANEVESMGMPAWLLVTDSEGMSVLTAWAAGKFDAEIIAKDAKRFNADEKVTRKRIVLPGHTAVLSGELEEELPDWEVKVGPKEAVDLPAYMKEVL